MAYTHGDEPSGSSGNSIITCGSSRTVGVGGELPCRCESRANLALVTVIGDLVRLGARRVIPDLGEPASAVVGSYPLSSVLETWHALLLGDVMTPALGWRFRLNEEGHSPTRPPLSSSPPSYLGCRSPPVIRGGRMMIHFCRSLDILAVSGSPPSQSQRLAIRQVAGA